MHSRPAFLWLQQSPRSQLSTFQWPYHFMLLGAPFEPVSSFRLTAYNSIWIFIKTTFTHPRTPRYGGSAFRHILGLDPYIRKFVSVLHTFSPWAWDTRHIGNIVHLWTSFVSLIMMYGCSLPTLPSFWHRFICFICASRSISVAFQALPHHSTISH